MVHSEPITVEDAKHHQTHSHSQINNQIVEEIKVSYKQSALLVST